MSLVMLSADQTDEGLAVTFGTENGIEQLVGSPDEMAHLARSMQQVAALGQANDHDSGWLDAVPVGTRSSGRDEPGRAGTSTDPAPLGSPELFGPHPRHVTVTTP